MTRGKYVLLGIAVPVVIVAVVLIGLALSWFGAAVTVVSPDNVKTQYADAYSRYNALQADACNVKGERTLATNATDPTVQVQYQQQETAYEQLFRGTAAAYDAAYQNAFQAKHVGPSDLPKTAPSLEEAIARC